MADQPHCPMCDGTGATPEHHGPGLTEILACDDCGGTGITPSRLTALRNLWADVGTALGTLPPTGSARYERLLVHIETHLLNAENALGAALHESRHPTPDGTA